MEFELQTAFGAIFKHVERALYQGTASSRAAEGASENRGFSPCALSAAAKAAQLAPR
jgi:hypothetical protein